MRATDDRGSPRTARVRPAIVATGNPSDSDTATQRTAAGVDDTNIGCASPAVAGATLPCFSSPSQLRRPGQWPHRWAGGEAAAHGQVARAGGHSRQSMPHGELANASNEDGTQQFKAIDGTMQRDLSSGELVHK